MRDGNKVPCTVDSPTRGPGHAQIKILIFCPIPGDLVVIRSTELLTQRSAGRC